MNWANRLTVARFFLTLLFVVSLSVPWHFAASTALVLFIVAGVTDYFDGVIARREKLITNFGALMDPLADKILICSAFIAFVERGWIEGWMVVIMVARELAITGLRLLAASQNVVLAAERYGKDKTVSQIVAIISVLVWAAYQQEELGPVGETIFGFSLFRPGPWVAWFAELFKWIAVILTLFSGVMYLWKNRKLYLEDR